MRILTIYLLLSGIGTLNGSSQNSGGGVTSSSSIIHRPVGSTVTVGATVFATVIKPPSDMKLLSSDNEFASEDLPE